MPSMRMRDPAISQAPAFDEEKARVEISQRISALYGDCIAKLGTYTIPNTILKAIPIATDEFHSEKIGEICRGQVNQINDRAKGEGAPVRLEVIQERNTLYIVDGRYRLKDEVAEPAKAEFDIGMHYFDISHSTLDGHLAALGSANLNEKDFDGLKETLVEAFAMKERGEITDAAHVGIVKNSDGNFELSHEGIIEADGRTTASAQSQDEPPNFELKQEYADILTPQVLSYASQISQQKFTTMQELTQNEELLFQSVLGVMTQKRQAIAYVVGMSNNPGFDFRNISDRTELTLDNNGKFKARVFKVISQSENDVDMLVKMPNGVIERCEIKNSDEGYLLYRKNWKRDKNTGKTLRNPNRIFSEMNGDCDEYALLAASYLKTIGFRGRVSLAEVRLTGNPPGHAFILGYSDKQGNGKYYRLDFTLKDTFEEFGTVKGKDGKVDWKESLKQNYAAGELLERNSSPKRVVMHEDFDQIESYLYQVKASNLFDYLADKISPLKQTFSNSEKIEQDSLNSMITRGLELDPRNSDLYATRGDYTLYWVIGFSQMGEKKAKKLTNSAKSDYCTAIEIDDKNDHAYFAYGAAMVNDDREIAKENALRALQLDPLIKSHRDLIQSLSQE